MLHSPLHRFYLKKLAIIAIRTRTTKVARQTLLY